MIVTAFSVHMQPVLACIIEIVFIVSTVTFLFAIHIAIHTAATNRTSQYAGEYMFMVKTMRFRLFFIGAFALDMCCPPGFLWNNRLVLPIYQHIIICSDNMIFISCSWYFFIMSASVSYFSEIYRIINNANDKCTGESFKFVVMPLDFPIAVLIQPICDLLCPHGCGSVFIEYDFNNFCFIWFNQQFTILKLIPIWSKSTVPFTFTGFLTATFHCLHQNVFPLDLGHGRKN